MTPQEIIDQINGLDPNNPGAWPRWAHIAASILLAVALIGAGVYFLIKPKVEDLERFERKESTLRADFERKQKKIANLDAYKAQLDEMRRSFGAMLRQLPSKTEVANLLNDISQTRVASGLEEELFQPEAEIQREFYAVIPNRINVVGTYHQMGEFVSGVAALPRIVTVDEVEIGPAQGAGRNITEFNGQVRMQASAKTFRYLEVGEGDDE